MFFYKVCKIIKNTIFTEGITASATIITDSVALI